MFAQSCKTLGRLFVEALDQYKLPTAELLQKFYGHFDFSHLEKSE